LGKRPAGGLKTGSTGCLRLSVRAAENYFWEFYMKKIFKIFGFIALIMVIGFSIAGCTPTEEEGGGGGDGNDGGGGGGGSGGIRPTITIKNNTGYTCNPYVKPSTETKSWGNG